MVKFKHAAVFLYLAAFLFYIWCMAMVINNIYNFGETVYLKTDKEQLPRIVFCLKVYKNEVIYDLACGTTVSSHYEFELSREVNILTTSTN